MTEPLDPIRPARPERRASDRRARERRAAAKRLLGPSLPVVLEAAAPVAPDPVVPAEPATVFAAQILGQPGEKRGLRGGPETLERAREAYLGALWRGPKDRRVATGKGANEEA